MLKQRKGFVHLFLRENEVFGPTATQFDERSFVPDSATQVKYLS